MENEKFNECLDLLKKVPVLSIPNAMRMTPYDHEGGIYYYRSMLNGQQLEFCVNTSREQWRADDKHHGDDALSLIDYLGSPWGIEPMNEKIVTSFCTTILKDFKHDYETPQRIPCKELPILGRQWVAKRYDSAFNAPFVKGMSSKVLRRQCYVVYKAKDKPMEETKETMRLVGLIRDTKDLNTLPEEDKKAIREHFTTEIALRNVNDGLQLFNGEYSYPEKEAGYCLFGGKNVEQGEKLYVYENIMDYLAMMEQRHKNGTEYIMPPAHHIIINGEQNLAEALVYIHDHCDFLNVVCMFPNDDKGRELFEKVSHVTRNTAEDASQLYVDNHFYSLYGKTAIIFDEAEYDAYKKSVEKEIDTKGEQYRKEHNLSDKDTNEQKVSRKENERKLTLPSAPKVSFIEKVKNKTRGFKM